MKITLAFLADHANVSQDGKINVLGMFERVFAPSFPTIHPELFLVVRLLAGQDEPDQSHMLEVSLIDPRDAAIAGFGHRLDVPGREPGAALAVTQILRIQHLVFEEPGDYRFDIRIGNDIRASVPFQVRLAGPEPA